MTETELTFIMSADRAMQQKMTEEQALALVLEAFEKLSMIQSGIEARDLALFCDNHGIADFIELGTAHGGMFYLLSRACRPGLRISLDRPWGANNGRYGEDHGYEAKFRAACPDAVEFYGDIHSPDTQRRLSDYLAGRKVDLIFADADHSKEGAKKHFEMYAQFIRPGGFFAMHDVGNHWPCQEWWEEEIMPNYRNWRLIEPANCYGIGIACLP